MPISKTALLASALAFATVTAGAVVTKAQPTPAASTTGTATLPDGPGLDFINHRCIFCHSTAQVFAARKTPADWAATVQRMADRGMEISPEEQQLVVDYLAKNLAPTSNANSGPGNAPRAAAGAASAPSPAPGTADSHGQRR